MVLLDQPSSLSYHAMLLAEDDIDGGDAVRWNSAEKWKRTRRDEKGMADKRLG